MESDPPRPHRWILISSLVIAAAAGIAVLVFIRSRKPDLTSSPAAVRPWAEAEFLRLTKPVPSTDSPLHPQFTASHGGPLPPALSHFKTRIVIHPPSAEFVPKYGLIPFDAADGFTSGTLGGKVRWIGTKAYELPENTDESVEPSVLDVFHPDGNPMTADETKAAGISKHDREAWGLELNAELGTAMKCLLELDGFANPQWKFQQVFDAVTQVPLGRQLQVSSTGNGLLLSASLAVLHDAPLLAVIDLAHGETRSFDIPLARKAGVSHSDFRLEVIDIFEGTANQGNTEQPTAKSLELQYGASTVRGAAPSFSVIYQINPPVMANAISVDALDATGAELKNLGCFMDHAPVSRFAAPLASATTLRIRYRPLQTRLLMHLKSLPGVGKPNLAPANLFDVAAPTITFRDSFQMRSFISNGTQLRDITGSWSHDTPAAFPLTLKNATPREVAGRYLDLDADRSIRIDPVDMTLEFEQPRKSKWFNAALKWLRAISGHP